MLVENNKIKDRLIMQPSAKGVGLFVMVIDSWRVMAKCAITATFTLDISF
jgi:hypothetical protein